MTTRRLAFLLLTSGVVSLGCKQDVPDDVRSSSSSGYAQFAPEDAYLEGSSFAYYGSENAWDRRFFSERTADQQYKRRGQRQMLAILDGQPERAAELCRARLQAQPGDAESLFVLTVALTQMGQLEPAMETVTRALDAGLPFGRFLAGPRDLLAPLTDTPAFRELAESRSVEIVHGPMLGAVTARSARFWVRTASEGWRLGPRLRERGGRPSSTLRIGADERGAGLHRDRRGGRAPAEHQLRLRRPCRR